MHKGGLYKFNCIRRKRESARGGEEKKGCAGRGGFPNQMPCKGGRDTNGGKKKPTYDKYDKVEVTPVVQGKKEGLGGLRRVW